jgi:two-component system cell cycle response regulator DivK
MSKAKILYIEDNIDNMTLVRRVLEIEGYEVIPAETGREGLAKAYENKPDIIITDINLPDIDGYEITDTLKKDKMTAHIPIIAMTANVMKKDRENVLQAGCDGYISKPIDIDELPAQVENFLRGRN